MRLLIVECGESKLPVVLSAQANQMKPRPEVISTVHLNMHRVNVPEFKKMLRDLTPDAIVVNPPDSPADKFSELMKEVARQVEVSSGECLLSSSVEVLGDASTRSEMAIPLPYSDFGVFLHGIENQLLGQTSRCFIVRFPYSSESKEVSSWLEWADPERLTQPAEEDKIVTLACPEDMAKVILTRLETGWYGLYHATPGDQVTLDNLLEIQSPDKNKRLPDRSLQSRTEWFDMRPSRAVWDQAWVKRYR